MPTVDEAKVKSLRTLKALVDPAATRLGFARPPRSLSYRRSADEVELVVDVGVQRPSNSSPEVEALVQVALAMNLPAIVSTVLVLGGGKRWAPAPPEQLFRVPLGQLAPDEQARVWRPVGARGWERCGRELATAFEDLVGPLCEAYATVAEVADGVQDGDVKLRSLDDAWPIRATATVHVARGREAALRFARRCLEDTKAAKRWPHLEARASAL